MCERGVVTGTQASVAAPIQTPDRRLRVFVSSTLGELADERRATERAIASLRLTPVLFELGARPHPPSELYRAYLAQSDVFIGLYWQQYGQFVAGTEMSGLEDEFNLSANLPRLLYIKAPAPDRDPRLSDLLSRVRDLTSYRTFRTTAELGRLVREDLASLLSERFVAGTVVAAPRPPSAPGPRPLPADATALIGREPDVGDVVAMLDDQQVRLVTLTGPGGVGKTRLALAVGDRLRDRFDAGTAFVPVAAITEPDQVLTGIGRAVGADLAGVGSPVQGLVEQFGIGRWLLILDNLEQVVDVAQELDTMLSGCPNLAILATSRASLRLRAEREYPVQPLSLPADLDDAIDAPVSELAAAPVVALFVDRARAVRHDFELNRDNARAVLQICRRLEGLPLAIELAAARIRLLEPDALLDRLAASLDALGTGPVDMPERQRTLRATVEWSLNLLDEAERRLVQTMAVFVDGWTIEALADVARMDEDRALDLSDVLLGRSLVRLDRTEIGPRWRMLETVREFIAAQARSDADVVQRRHAEHFRGLAEQADTQLRGIGHRSWTDRLQAESGNLDAAIQWYLVHEVAPLPHLFRVLYPFWEMRDELAKTRAWTDQLLPSADSMPAQARVELMWTATVTAAEAGDDTAALAAHRRLEPLVRTVQDSLLHAVSVLAIAWTLPILGDLDRAVHEAAASLDQLRPLDSPFWTAASAGTLGTLEMVVARHSDALVHLGECRDLADRIDNAWLAGWSRAQLGNLAVIERRPDDARPLLDEALTLSLTARSIRAMTLCLTAFARLAYVDGEVERAALLAGAAEGLGRRTGLRGWPTMQPGEAELLSQIGAALGPDRFNGMFEAGAKLSQRDAVAAIRS